MRITHWRLVPYELKMATPYAWARGTQRVRRGVLVMLRTDEGLDGWGEVAPPPDDPTTAQELRARARALLDRLGPDDGDRFLDAVDAHGPDPRIRAGLSGAWHDAAARAAGQPLARYLAATNRLGRDPAEEVPVNALITLRAPREAAEAAVRAADAGFRTLKLKSDGDVSRDVQRLKAVREAAGDVALRLDPNGAWSVDHALRHLEQLRRFDLEYVEQPVPPQDPRRLAALRHRSPVPLAWDESVTDARAARLLTEADAADALVLKPARLGGPDGAVETIRAAEAAGVPAVVTTSIESAVGRAHAAASAALVAPPVPACGLATESYLADDVSGHGPRARDGRIRLEDAPGIGFQPNVPETDPVPLGGP